MATRTEKKKQTQTPFTVLAEFRTGRNDVCTFSIEAGEDAIRLTVRHYAESR